MSRVLFIIANDRPAEQSVSVQMYETFLQTYKEANPQDHITELDLYHAELPYYGNKTISGLYKLSLGLEPLPEELKAARIANRYMDQFLAADKAVFAFPLWNHTVPAPLITYISYLTQSGKTFQFTEEGITGLAAGKKVALLNARGGDYSNSFLAGMEMSLAYVRNMLGMWGIHDPEVAVIEGHNQYPDRASQIVEEGLQKTAKLAASF
ncbi:FMN-dependent NADH-azoreductase [Paenibacillus sp. H1-7]|nr:FMN-dependent NADH-azoreductase [Paenibacillus sp. H1-7]ULL19594.1 FMN-dependent NADH-azoreductase [Paenibacillus sp. H1-7]